MHEIAVGHPDLTVALTIEGVPQTFASYTTATSLDGAEQVIPLGPPK